MIPEDPFDRATSVRQKADRQRIADRLAASSRELSDIDAVLACSDTMLNKSYAQELIEHVV
jgi:hypothetical protein